VSESGAEPSGAIAGSVDDVTVRYVQERTLRTAYFEVGLASAMKARSLIEAQGGLPLRTRRQQDLVAVGLPGNIERMSKNPSAESQPTVVGMSDDILNHPV